MSQKKGKEGTKGQGQIVKENSETVAFYRDMILGACAIYAVVNYFLDAFTLHAIIFFILAIAVYSGSYQFMVFMSRPKKSESGQILDSGFDLNMEGGIAEDVKDLIILTAISQTLSLISTYFWLLWLLAPGKAFWMLWKNILSPYFFQPGSSEPEIDEKKQRKMERRMRRH